jgi:phage baseplate assembly protein gpV
MGIVSQYSRISHHTLFGLTGSTFSVPTTEDFTDGSWTIYDLALSEIGVNESDKKVYIRIDDEIKELAFAATGSTAETLEQTLAVGNSMGTYSINMAGGKILSAGQTSSFTMTDFETRFVSDSISVINSTAIWTQDNSYKIKEQFTTGITQSKMFYVDNSEFPTESLMTIDVIIQGLDPTNMLYYFNKMMATFWCSGGVVVQVGTTDVNEKTNFSTGVADITTDGSEVQLNVEGDAGSDVYWSARINYQISSAV